MTVAREGLRRACGLEPWHPDLPIRIEGEEDWNGIGMRPAEAWAELVNQLAAPPETEPVTPTGEVATAQ
jgi:hypothetical protein